MEKEMSPMTTEILKKGYLLFPIPRRYTRFGVSLWDMPDPDNECRHALDVWRL